MLCILQQFNIQSMRLSEMRGAEKVGFGSQSGACVYIMIQMLALQPNISRKNGSVALLIFSKSIEHGNK